MNKWPTPFLKDFRAKNGFRSTSVIFVFSYFLILLLVSSCEKPSGPEEKAAKAPPLDEELKPLSVAELFGDVVFTKEDVFTDDPRAERTSRVCGVHQTPIYRVSGYSNGLTLSHAESYITYTLLALDSGYCPNGVGGGPTLDAEPGYEGAEFIESEFCCACNHVFDVVENRFMELEESEQKRWRDYLDAKVGLGQPRRER